MRLPSCIRGCFGSTVSVPEAESSHFSVGRIAGTSGVTCSGVLSSFMRKRSCSRGTCETSATDITKARPSAKANGADIVTLATARYLELFAAGPKNDDSVASLSDERAGQDSMRFVRTASEFHVSRSSTLTAMGRASREVSRLASAHHHHLQLPAHPPSALAPSAQRRSASSTRRSSGPHLPLPDPPMSPTAATTEPSQPPGPQVQTARKHLQPAVANAPQAAPFTNKTRSLAATVRSRSDRLSPSAAACLLPAPSVRNIARAHTALQTTSVGSTGISHSTSTATGDLQEGASGGSSAAANAIGAGICCAAITRSSIGFAPAPSSTAATTADRRLQVAIIRRSRLYTESGGAMVGAAGPGCGLGLNEQGVEVGGCPGSRSLAQLQRSSASGAIGGAGAVPHRRASIHFCRDGDVTVTGLPPACLIAGRASRKKDLSGGIPFAGAPPGVEGSGSFLCSTGAVPGAHVDRSVDGFAADCGLCLGTSAAGEVVPAIFLASRSHDSAGHCPPSQNLGRAGASSALASFTVDMMMDTSRAEPAGYAALVDGKLAADGSGTAHDGACQEPPQREQHAAAVQKRVPDSLLGLAISSSDGQRCDWGGSSVYMQSRCSNSSRLMHGNMTAGAVTTTPSQVSHNISDKLVVPHVGAHSAISSAVAVALRSAASSKEPLEQAPQLPLQQQFVGLHHDDTVATAQTGSGNSFVGFPAGCTGTGLSKMIGMSAAAVREPCDVTSALTRLQEACMAAVAQGDMRSQRLCKRHSTELPILPAYAQQHMSGLLADFYMERSSSMGPNWILGAGGSKPQIANAVAGTDGSRSSNVRTGHAGAAPSARTASAHFPLAEQPLAPSPPGEVALGWTAPDAGSGACPNNPANPTASTSANTAAAGACVSNGGLWTLGPDTTSGAGPHSSIILDGEGHQPEQVAAGVLKGSVGPTGTASDGPGRDGRPAQHSGTDATAEEYRNRLLNVLLRGDFLHDTCDSVSPGSDEDDDGVVEYRYGGFELGGGEGDYSFRRQASFMEAVRKCATFNPAGSNAAAFDAGAPRGGAVLPAAAPAPGLG